MNRLAGVSRAVAFVLSISLANAAVTLAQPSTIPLNVPSRETQALLFPRVMASFGLSATDTDDSDALKTLSVQFLAARHILVEADVSAWTSRWDYRGPGTTIYSIGPARVPVGSTVASFNTGTRESWSTGVNLLFRTEPRRVTAYVGGGPIWGFVHQRSGFGSEGCTTLPGFESRCPENYDTSVDRNQAGLRGATGLDVLIARGIRAYSDFQVLSLDDAYLRFSAGVRVDVLKQSGAGPSRARARRIARVTPPSRSVDGAIGEKVRVTFAGGKRVEGTLAALSPDGLVVRHRGELGRYPLDQILIVETTHHAAGKGAIAGAIGGALFGVLMCHDECLPEAAIAFGAIGAAAGAGIGAGIDHAGALAHVVYVAPAVSSSPVRVTPILGAGQTGARLSLAW